MEAVKDIEVAYPHFIDVRKNQGKTYASLIKTLVESMNFTGQVAARFLDTIRDIFPLSRTESLKYQQSKTSG